MEWLLQCSIFLNAYNGNSFAQLQIVQRFQPLLKKYAALLKYEDAYSDLQLYLLELLHSGKLTKLQRKDEELSMADAIFVASNFTKRTLELFPGQLAPIHLIPYGFPEVYKNRKYENIANRKLKLLFVGGLSQLKGIANLFEAVNYLGERVKLTIVGRKVVQGCIPLERELKKHNWIPSLPHDQILSLMRSQDVFVFPSLFEGYGLVIAEAMSQGTPVITTTRTCGADFIEDGKNGWLVDPGDTQGLIEKLEQILSHPEIIPQVGRAARDTAKELPMSIYGEKMVEAIGKIINRD